MAAKNPTEEETQEMNEDEGNLTDFEEDVDAQQPAGKKVPKPEPKDKKKQEKKPKAATTTGQDDNNGVAAPMDAGDDDPYVQVEVQAVDTAEMALTVRMKKLGTFNKLIDTFCKRFNLDTGRTRFLYDGQRLHSNPLSLGMRNGDIIEVHSKQDGGM